MSFAVPHQIQVLRTLSAPLLSEPSLLSSSSTIVTSGSKFTSWAPVGCLCPVFDYWSKYLWTQCFFYYNISSSTNPTTSFNAHIPGVLYVRYYIAHLLFNRGPRAVRTRGWRSPKSYCSLFVSLFGSRPAPTSSRQLWTEPFATLCPTWNAVILIPVISVSFPWLLISIALKHCGQPDIDSPYWTLKTGHQYSADAQRYSHSVPYSLVQLASTAKHQMLLLP